MAKTLFNIPPDYQTRTALSQKSIPNANGILNSDARYTSYEIAGLTRSLEVSTCTFLMKNLGLTHIDFQWIPYMLTNEQKSAHVKIAKNY